MERSPSAEARPAGCLSAAVLGGLWLVCGFGPALALATERPLTALGTAPIAVLVWARYGVRPIPGLLPGCAATLVLLINADIAVTALIALTAAA